MHAPAFWIRVKLLITILTPLIGFEKSRNIKFLIFCILLGDGQRSVASTLTEILIHHCEYCKYVTKTTTKQMHLIGFHRSAQYLYGPE
jgi:hypothetical protein